MPTLGAGLVMIAIILLIYTRGEVLHRMHARTCVNNLRLIIITLYNELSANNYNLKANKIQEQNQFEEILIRVYV